MSLGINGWGRRSTNYPAPGFRANGNGALSYVGNAGYNWSSAVSSTDGMNLNFRVIWLYSIYANNRGYGLQLRCLSE